MNQSTKINLIGCDTIVNSPSCTCSWGFPGSCSVCENCAVKTKEERPDGWPPDNPALYHTIEEWWATLIC